MVRWRLVVVALIGLCTTVFPFNTDRRAVHVGDVLFPDGMDPFHNGSRQKMTLRYDVGLVSYPLVGTSLEWSIPNLKDTLLQARVTYIYNVLKSETPVSRTLSGHEGLAYRLTFGMTHSSRTITRPQTLAFDLLNPRLGLRAEKVALDTLVFQYQVPEFQSRWFLVDVWSEPNGVWGPLLRDTVSGKHYREFGEGTNVYVVPKWRFMSETHWQTDISGETAQQIKQMVGKRARTGAYHYSKTYWFDIGPVVSTDLKQLGGWIAYHATMNDVLFFNLALGAVYNTEVPEYKVNGAGALVKTGEGDHLYLPMRMSVGLRW